MGCTVEGKSIRFLRRFRAFFVVKSWFEKGLSGLRRGFFLLGGDALVDLPERFWQQDDEGDAIGKRSEDPGDREEGIEP